MEQDVVDSITKMALALPGMLESVSYGTKSFKVKDKLIARFHEDGVSLVLKMDMDTRDFLMQAYPQTYSITEHYRNYPFVLVDLSHVDLEELKGYLHKAWKAQATQKLLKAFEAMKPE